MSKTENKFGVWLKEQRTSANLSQEQVADKIGVSRVCISNWERGRQSSPTKHRCKQLTKLFDVGFGKVWRLVVFEQTPDVREFYEEGVFEGNLTTDEAGLLNALRRIDHFVPGHDVVGTLRGIVEDRDWVNPENEVLKEGVALIDLLGRVHERELPIVLRALRPVLQMAVEFSPTARGKRFLPVYSGEVDEHAAREKSLQ